MRIRSTAPMVMPESFASREQVGNGNQHAWSSERRHRCGGTEDLDRPIGPAVRGILLGLRLTIHLEHTVDEVDDPVFFKPCPRIEAGLQPAVKPQARIGDFDNKGGGRGVRAEIVTISARTPRPPPLLSKSPIRA